MTAATVEVKGQNLLLKWDRYDLDGYRTFLRAKALPEKLVAWDRDTDTYTLTTHRRHAARLGLSLPDVREDTLPISAIRNTV